DAGDTPPQCARQAEPGARAAADVEIAPVADPRQAAPAETRKQRSRPEASQEADVAIAKVRVPEPARERPAHRTDPRRGALERHSGRRLLMPRIVVGVARRQVLAANARPLIEEAAVAAPRDSVETRDGERAVGGSPHRFGALASTEHARRVDRRETHRPPPILHFEPRRRFMANNRWPKGRGRHPGFSQKIVTSPNGRLREEVPD